MHDTEREPADPAIAPAEGAPGTPPSPPPDDPGAESGPSPDRRAFLNNLSRDAVSTAGRVAGLSSVFRRSIFAAGEAMVGAFDPDPTTDAGPNEAPTGSVTAGAQTAPSPSQATTDTAAPPTTPAVDGNDPAVAPIAAPPASRAVPDPVAALTADQHAFLAGQPRIILAANDPAGPPHVTISEYHWDGAVFTMPTQLFTLRASNVESDPRVSLFIEASGASVAITGLATVVYGDQVAPAMLRILERDHDPAEARTRWESMRAGADRMIIEVRPKRFVWRQR